MTGETFIVYHGLKINFSNRLFEWCASLIMVMMAVLLEVPGVTMSGFFRLLYKFDIVGPASWFLFVFGLIRFGALIANGNIKVLGPRIRTGCAMVAAQIWATFGGVHIWEAISYGRISLGIALYTGLLIGELYSVNRATLDVGRC